MAKRKRLTPAKIDETPALETKQAIARYPLGVAPKTRAPIADVAQDAAATAAFTEVAQTLTDARTEGRLIQKLPLETIVADHLVRDRIAVDADEMSSLMESIRTRGQQTAIEVTDLGDGRYGLISGWRRLQALRALTPEFTEIDTVLAIIRQPDDAAGAYLAMVEENEIRVGLSFYERARIVARAVDRGVYRADRVALPALFHAASRAKRSKIGAFIKIVRALDDHLRFPTSLTERSGLALAQAIEHDSTVILRITSALTPPALSAQAEADAIAKAITPQAKPVAIPAQTPSAPAKKLGYACDMNTDAQITITGDLARDAGFRTALAGFLKAYTPK